MRSKPRIHLRTHRKRSGLTQTEMAFLLSGRSGSKVSRYEHGGRRPGVKTAFGYQVIFGVPAHELLEGVFAEVEQAIIRRADLLTRRLRSGRESARLRRKLGFLGKLTSRSR